MSVFRAIVPVVVCLSILASVPSRADEAPVLSSALPPGIARTVQSLFEAIGRRDSPEVKRVLGRLVTQRKAAQIANLTRVAAAFLARFDVATAGASPAETLEIATLAVGLAPDLPDLRFHLARVRLRDGVQGIGPAVRALFEGFGRYPVWPRGLFAAGGNASFHLVLAFAALALIAALMLLLRYGRLLAHDLGDRLPSARGTAFSVRDVARSRGAIATVERGLIRVLSQVAMLLFFLAPLALGLGLLCSPLLWAVVVVPYARRTEIVAILWIALGVACVVPLGMMVRAPDVAAAGEGALTWTCIREHCSHEEGLSLVKSVAKAPGDTWVRVALGLREVQDGEGNAERLAGAAEHLLAADPDAGGVARTVSGNVSVLRALAKCQDDKPDQALLVEARKSYDEATQKPASGIAALKGKAIAEGLRQDRTAMEKTLEQIVSMLPDEDLDFVARIRTLTTGSTACTSYEPIAAELITPPIPDLRLYVRSVEAHPVALPYERLLLGMLSPVAVLVVAGIAVLLAVVLVILRGRMSLAAPCPRCGSITCGTCNLRSSGFDYCPACLFDQVKPALLDPLDQVARDRKTERRRAGRRWLVPVVALLLPGAGQILAGRAIRGCLLLFFAAVAVSLALWPVPPLTDSVAYQGVASGGLPVFPPVLLLLVYGLSAIDVWRNRGRTE